MPVLFKKAIGKYIALCEGDDCWVDKQKIQKQIDFLESNPEYSGIGHQSKIIDSYGKIKRDYYRKKEIPSILSKQDFLEECPFQTATFVFRAKIVKEHIIDIDITSGDKALMLLVSRYGLIKNLNESMSLYRQHEEGLSSVVTGIRISKDLNIIPWILKIDPKFSRYKYAFHIHKMILRFSKNDSIFFIFKHYFLALIFSFSFFPKNLKKIYRVTRDVYNIIKQKYIFERDNQ